MFVKSMQMVLIVGAALASAAVQASPKIQHWTLDNGVRVYFVESHELPLLQVSAVFDAGSIRDIPEKSGVAMLTNQMLGEGAAGLDANQIAERFDFVGAEFGSGSGRDMVSVGLRVLTDQKLRDPAIQMLADILQAPTFPDDALARERSRAITALSRIKQSPNEIGNKAFMEQIYRGHPYGLYPAGSEAGLKALTRADLEQFYRRYYVGANALIAIVGDIGTAEAKKIAQRVLGKLPRGEAAAPLPPVADVAKPVVQTIDYPSAQTHMLVGAPGMARDDPDYFPLFVGNYVLGGAGLVSRLSNEIREKHGLSYSVYSYFNPLKQRGPFVMGLQTKGAQRAQALKLLKSTLADFVANGPTAAELEAAKKHLTGSFPLRIDSNNKIVDYLAVIGFYRLPLTYLDEFIARVEAVSAEQIRAAFARHVHPERMVTVSVGGGN